jgi:hypothetical protein
MNKPNKENKLNLSRKTKLQYNKMIRKTKSNHVGGKKREHFMSASNNNV